MKIREFFEQFWLLTLATVAGTLLATAFLALNWTAVKVFFAGVGGWLAAIGVYLVGATGVPRLMMLANFLVLAAFAWSALRWHRSRTSSAPVSAPVVALSAPAIPADFKPSKLQVALVFALMHRWQKESNLKVLIEMIEDVNPELLPMMPEAHISSDLEVLEAANVVSIDRLGTRHAYYYLTPLGREWTIKAIKKADERLRSEKANRE